MIVDLKFLEDNIEEFIKTYFELNSDNRARKKQYTDRWLNTIGKESKTKDKVKISEQTILYIQEIIKLRHEKKEERKVIQTGYIKKLQNRISELEKKINEVNTICETWRKITQVLSKYIQDKDIHEYYKLIDELGVNKGYYGL
tara:strand:+ start:200 stop:628 length:429 start_codon:yes stop_codon:yes gene_type:complete